METLELICQLVIGLGILNVWFLRFNKRTEYRGGAAGDLKQEFAVYGLPDWSVWLIGTLKIGAAVALLVGLGLPVLVFPAATLMAVLMLGAISMHIKVGDPAKKSVPAAVLLLMSLFLVYTHLPTG